MIGGLRLALAGHYQHASHPALHDTVATYRIPAQYLEAVIDGVEMDLEPVAYRTFAELRNYCYHVASVVGLSCIHIWGFRGPDAMRFAEDAGIAFQLTNILRDLGEDAARGRVYLPEEDLGSEAARKAVAFSDEIQAEDVSICEIVQKNLHSRSYHSGRYSVKQEKGVHAFHQMYRELMPA